MFPDTKLEEHKVNETEVSKIMTEVAVAKREAEIVSRTFNLLCRVNPSMPAVIKICIFEVASH